MWRCHSEPLALPGCAFQTDENHWLAGVEVGMGPTSQTRSAPVPDHRVLRAVDAKPAGGHRQVEMAGQYWVDLTD
jgi:hypothetical protein